MAGKLCIEPREQKEKLRAAGVGCCMRVPMSGMGWGHAKQREDETIGMGTQRHNMEYKSVWRE